jgi:hypothetical protein
MYAAIAQGKAAVLKSEVSALRRSMIKVGVATACFGLVHSAFASRSVKLAAARSFGNRNRNGLYRVAYIGQSFVTFGLLVAYIRRQPNRELYHIRGPLAGLMYLIQAGVLAYATAAARQVGLRRITGIESFLAWQRKYPVPPEPEAQGPGFEDGELRQPLGPFTCSRHPLNFAPLPIFWLWPRMTTNLLALTVTSTAYLVVGSLHEEARLRDAFGDNYNAYLKSGVPFYIPTLKPRRKRLVRVPATLQRVPQ